MRDLEAAMRRVPVLICVTAVLVVLATAGPGSAAGGSTDTLAYQLN